MILILVALIAVVALAIWGSTQNWSMFSELICPMFGFFGFIGLFGYAVLGWHYIAAEQKANIINREYSTNYTQTEVFYASDVIDTIREINRNRIELNGNLITGK